MNLLYCRTSLDYILKLINFLRPKNNVYVLMKKLLHEIKKGKRVKNASKFCLLFDFALAVKMKLNLPLPLLITPLI